MLVNVLRSNLKQH